ncbi:hypothetical protein PCANC_17466 [Puccinia coronata f. sp. avenae]|uniref:ABC transmembrane type-1 domain-containing protein n=1 Tax=Puccinia coronata f. sp. avenae TaxID=200324 RepID=A0A2N5SMB6_9BASI|nr:hypothetical protein PCANC_17466 [Puccinia coronata f. sp. avenae]PLW41822.1 hypothetical protein PCASD_05542 [Puccinia coronata f. sp. avenae]
MPVAACRATTAACHTQSSARNPRQESAVLMRRPSTPTLRNRHKEALKSLKAPQKVLEHKEKGSVKYNVYKTYRRANGVANVAIALASTVVKKVFSLMTTLWLKHWSSKNQHPSGNPQLHLGYYLAVYSLLGFFTGLAAFVNGVTLFSVWAVCSARVLHDRMFAKVLRAPMLFFDS